MNIIILKMLIKKYSYNRLTISLENSEISPVYSNQSPGLHSPARSIGTSVVVNTCSEPLPNLALMPSYQQTQKWVVAKGGALIEVSNKRQQSTEWRSHVIPSHFRVTLLGCFSLLKKSSFCYLALVRTAVSSRQATCVHFFL